MQGGEFERVVKGDTGGVTVPVLRRRRENGNSIEKSCFCSDVIEIIIKHGRVTMNAISNFV